MPSQVFLDMLSQPCRAVYMFVKKNHLPVEVKMISLWDGGHYTEEFQKVNPLRKVPALSDGDFCMGESIPMMAYMAKKFKVAKHWYPKDPQKRARVDEYLSWQHLAMRMHGSKMLYIMFLAPVVFKMEVPKDKVDAAMEDLNSSLDHIEKNFIKEGGFIGGGDKISIADLVAIAEIMQPLGAGVDVFKGRSKLTAWKERVVQAVGKELFDEAHKTIMSLRDSADQFDLSKLEAFRPIIQKLIS